MLEKLQSGVPLAEHELLEILLFNAIPRMNTNPLSHRLIKEFGDIRGVLEADMEKLTVVEGLGAQGAAYLKCVGAFIERYYVPPEDKLPETYTKDSFYRYISDRFKGYTYEAVELYAVSSDNGLVRCNIFTEHRRRGVALRPQEIIKTIADLSGRGLLIVHNHVDCSCAPSAADDELTKQCEILCSINNVQLLDHIIYSDSGIYSYYDSERMPQISREFHISNLLEKKN
jgi:DNA repair protein RadC